MKKTVLISTVLLLALGCNKDGFDKTDTGLRYKMHTKNEGAKPKEGDVLTMNMVYKRADDDSVLFDTYKTKTPVRVPLQKATFQGGIEEAFGMLSVGDSATFRISADSVYLKTFRAPELPPFIKKGTDLVFIIKMEKIQSSQEVEAEFRTQQEAAMKAAEERKVMEPQEIEKYVKDNNISVSPTKTGLYSIVNKPGTGAPAVDGKTVTVNYTGKLLNGNIFDTSVESVAKQAGIHNPQRKYEPFQFVLGDKNVIPGWEEAIRTMKVGGKSTFLIPSSLAYGPQGAGDIIPAYSPLLFEVELISVK